MRIVKYLVSLLFLFLFVQNVSAQSSDEMKKDMDPFLQGVVNDLNEVEGKIESLAEAIPQEDYDWRPMEGVRSESEVLKHVAGANYFLLSFAGSKKNQGMGEDMGKNITSKEQIVKMLKDSYAYTKDFVSKMNPDDLNKEVEMFGSKSDYRGVLFILTGHGHEHLGQLIAYARSNHVVPPWSMKK